MTIHQIPVFDEWGTAVVGYREHDTSPPVSTPMRPTLRGSTWVNPARPLCEYDLECDHHWFLAKFYLPDGRMFSHTICAESAAPLEYARIRWYIENYTLVGFNNHNYDDLMLRAAMAGASVYDLKRLNDRIIVGGLRRWHFDDQYPQYPALANWDSIDVMEVAPGVRIGLKTYMGRMHSKRLQDLPFDPHHPMPIAMRAVTDDYCGNDLVGTREIREAMADRLALRIATGERYGVDLRSKSDAQMAEGIIKARLPFRPAKRYVPDGYRFQYESPAFLEFHTPQMRQAFDTIRNAWFVVRDVDQIKSSETEKVIGPDGKEIKTGVKMPPELKSLRITIGESTYQLGIGGLHSTEKSVAHHSVLGVQTVSDHDVASYYPSLILLLGMYPEQIGPVFLEIYREIYEGRLHAKSEAKRLRGLLDKLLEAPEHERTALAKALVDAATKEGGDKIVLNGTFGKLFSKYSIMFAPELGIRVTLTGQLSLLMLIEMLHLHGIRVVSANTDGIVVITPYGKEWARRQCIEWWERRTGLKMEDTFYRSIYQRDVNNYIAVKLDGKHKGKGAYAESGIKNNVHPERDVCVDAVVAYVTKGTPVAETIHACQDLRRFLIIRGAKGGGYDADGNYLGKTVRWYYAAGETRALHYKRKEDGSDGNKIAGSTGARPCMELPNSFPSDVDYPHYVEVAEKMLAEIGVKNA